MNSEMVSSNETALLPNSTSNSTWNGGEFVIMEADTIPKSLPQETVLTFVIIYVLIIALAIVGNLVVIIVIGLGRMLHTVTDMFILSLAVSDLSIAVLNMPFQLYSLVMDEWTIGETWCKLHYYIQGVTIVASILTLTTIALDRFIVICHERLSRKLHKKRIAAVALISIWSIALLILIPHVLYQRLDWRIKVNREEKIIEGFGYLCGEFFPNGRHDSRIFTIVIYVFLYLIPLGIMIFSYGAIAYRLWIRIPIGDVLENPLQYERRAAERKKIIKMLVTLFVAFTVLWFPFFTATLYKECTEEYFNFRTEMAVFQMIGYTNCCVNPIIYTFLNRNFQTQFVKMCCKRYNSVAVVVSANQPGSRPNGQTSSGTQRANRPMCVVNTVIQT